MGNVFISVITEAIETIELAVAVVIVSEQIELALRSGEKRKVGFAAAVHVIEPAARGFFHRVEREVQAGRWRGAAGEEPAELQKQHETQRFLRIPNGGDQCDDDSSPLSIKKMGTSRNIAENRHAPMPTATAMPKDRMAGTLVHASEPKPMSAARAQIITA